MAQVMDLYEALRNARSDEERARIIARAFEALEDRYPNLADMAANQALRETELRLLAKIEETRKEMREIEANLRRDIKQMETALRKEMKEIEAGLRKEIKEIEANLRKEIEALRVRDDEIEAGLRKEMKEIEANLRKEMKEIEANLRRDIEALRRETESVRLEIAELRAEFARRMQQQTVFIITAIGLFAAIMGWLARLGAGG